MEKNIKIIPIEKEGNSTIIALMAKIGGRHETPEIKGISHFTEHMCFKGTKKRKQTEIAKEIEQYGGDLNAFTDWELTCYLATISNQYTEKALDIILDLVTQPVFPAKEIDKEREVIIQELKMYEDDPKDYVWDLFNKTYFKDYSGFHIPIIGTKKSLYDIHQKEILDFYNNHYKNLVLIIVGDTQKCKGLQTFDDSTEKPSPYESLIYEKESNFRLEKRKNLTQANILIGNYLNSIKGDINDFYLLELLENIYNGMSGRLFIKIREKYNLCYRIKFIKDTFSDGLILWAVSIGLEKNKIHYARKMIIEELNRPFNKKEIEIAIQQTIGETDLYYDNNYNIMNTIAYAETKYLDYHEFLCHYDTKIKKISKKLNEFREQLNFKNNLLVGVIPE